MINTKKPSEIRSKKKHPLKVKTILELLICFGLYLSLTQPANAQDEDYSILVQKDFGYNMGSSIQGRFTIRLDGDEKEVTRTTFFIDGQILAAVEAAPFSFQFQTEQFDPGVHKLYAEILLEDGQTQSTPYEQYIFLSQSEANRQVRTILIGIGGAVVGTLLLTVIIQGLIIKQGNKYHHKPGTPRDYGVLGGTICPKCSYPFPRHIWGINLLIGRLDRCDNCGKWVMTVRATPQVLRMAEDSTPINSEKDGYEFQVEKHENELLDETKYLDKL